jgi:hypothetical protein
MTKKLTEREKAQLGKRVEAQVKKMREEFERRLHNDEAKSVSFAHMVEVGRELYESVHGRRVQLIAPHIMKFFAEQEEMGNTRSVSQVPMDEFIGAVFEVANDKNIDHATFDSMEFFDAYGDHEDELRFQNYICKYLEAMEALEEREALPAHENCPARVHIPYKYFAVYDHAVAVSRGRAGGICWLSPRVLGNWCRDLYRPVARRGIGWLVSNGWLVELVAPKVGREGRGRYEVVLHDEWVANHGTKECRKQSAKRTD